MDRDLQIRPRRRYLADAVAGADAAGDSVGDAEDPAGCCERVEEGEAVDYRLDAACFGASVDCTWVVDGGLWWLCGR